MEKKKIKIALFTDTLCDANGVSRFIQDMSKEALESLDIELKVFTATVKDYCDTNDNIHIYKPVFRFKMPFYKELDIAWPPYFKMSKAIKEFAPDIVHVSTPGFIGLAGRNIAKRKKLPILGTYHTDFPMYLYKNTNSNIAKEITSYVMKLYYKPFRAMVTRSPEYLEIIEKDIRFKKEHIHFLSAGTNTRRFRPKFKDDAIWERYGIPKEGMKFLYVGRISKEKNVQELFDIWKAFFEQSSLKTSHLVLVGTGALQKHKEELKQYNVDFLGHKNSEELAPIYASSTLFLFPSITDTLGQVVLEAIASALPVVVTDIGGPRGIVESASEPVGFVRSMNNHNHWVELLHQIEKGEVDIEQMAQNAYQHSKNYSITKTFEDFIDIHRFELNRL
ncbi:MAG: glycosyltransferase family 1 protein [Campylobacterales bacterium]|nr:glycosyltransferase family 1 protein [Campylobacterales bacterium]